MHHLLLLQVEEVLSDAKDQLLDHTLCSALALGKDHAIEGLVLDQRDHLALSFLLGEGEEGVLEALVVALALIDIIFVDLYFLDQGVAGHVEVLVDEPCVFLVLNSGEDRVAKVAIALSILGDQHLDGIELLRDGVVLHLLLVGIYQMLWVLLHKHQIWELLVLVSFTVMLLVVVVVETANFVLCVLDLVDPSHEVVGHLMHVDLDAFVCDRELATAKVDALPGIEVLEEDVEIDSLIDLLFKQILLTFRAAIGAVGLRHLL